MCLALASIGSAIEILIVSSRRKFAVVFYASGYPRSVPGMPLERNLYGISFAVANMTGFVARACESLAKRSPQTIREALIAEAGATIGTSPV